MMLKTVLAFCMITFALQLIISLVTLVWGVHIVLPEIVNHSFWLYVALPMLIDFVKLSGHILGMYYIALVLIIIGSAIWMFAKSWKGFVLELAMKGKSREHSAFFDTCALMFATLFVSVFVALFVSAAGGLPTDPVSDVDLWELLFLLANASVWEEVVVRILLIGIPLLAVDLARRRLRPKKLAYVMGGGFTIGVPEAALIVISATVFGFAHLEGWGWWKVFPATIGGIAMGYLFVKHGLWAAIMLHFGTDYLSMPLEMFGNGFVAQLVLSLGLLLWIGLGLIFCIYFTVRIAEFVTGRKLAEEKPHLAGAPTVFYPSYQYGGAGGQYLPPPPGPQPGPEITVQSQVAPGFGGIYVCPYCGYTEARWADGRFQCLRCGRLT